jgi:hypothetical protein
MFLPTARWRATPDPKTKAAELSSSRFDETPFGASEKIPSLGLGFLLGLFLLRHDRVPWCLDEPTAGLVQSQAMISVPGPSPPYRAGQCHSPVPAAIEKTLKVFIFP